MRLHRFSSLILKKNYIFFVGFLFLALFGAVGISSPVFAEYQQSNGIFTDANDVRWEYVRQYDTETAKEAVVIKFFDKPANTTEIIVPSLSEVLSNVPNASVTLDTYFLDDADADYQAEHFTETKRESTATINKLDMSNTAKIQILGVRPMIDSDIMTELVFGDEMVIGDVLGRGSGSGSVGVRYCNNFRDDRGYFACTSFSERSLPLDSLPFWYLLTTEEKLQYSVSSFSEIAEFFDSNYIQGNFKRMTIGFGYYDYLQDVTELDSTAIYYSDVVSSRPYVNKSNGVFSGYKLKLTNLGNFNYVGWATFANSTFDDNSRTIELNDGFGGGKMFSKSNVNKVILKTNYAGEGAFEDCADLTELVIDDSVDTISSGMFMGTNLGDLDFSNTNIKTIRARAFKNANISSLDISGLERLEYQAFANNTNISEVYMPKSLNWLGAQLFDRDNNLKKITVAYDTLTSGTAAVFHAVLDDGSSNRTLEELTVLAPYGEDEEVSPTHVAYQDYKYHYNYNNEWCEWGDDGRTGGNNYGWSGYSGYTRENEQQSEVDYADVDSKKNVIAPMYFAELKALKKIVIGEGYEFIGAQAFWDTSSIPGYASQITGNQWAQYFETGGLTVYSSSIKVVDQLTLPTTLKGVGNFAFGSGYGGLDIGISLPESLEYIGVAAFRGVVALKGDFDLPNVKFLGDEALSATQTRDIVLHDTLQYFGKRVFANCPFVRNITVDYDMYNPTKNSFWNTSRSTFYGSLVYNDYDNFAVWFGINDYWSVGNNREVLEEHGMEFGTHIANGETTKKKYGTIKYTNKVVTGYPTDLYATYNSNNKGPFFAYNLYEKIDLSECGWTVIPPHFFSLSTVGEVLLPANTTYINESAFNSASIRKELVLPDSVYNISKSAFNQARLVENDLDTIKITKLPESLYVVGDFAFYGDNNLTADFDTGSIVSIGEGAFSGTGLRDITLSNALQFFGKQAFFDIQTIRDLTVDIDIVRYGNSNGWWSFTSLFNQSGSYSLTAELTVDHLIITDSSTTAPGTTTLELTDCIYGAYYSSYSDEYYCYTNERQSSYDYTTGQDAISVQSSYFYGLTANSVDLSNVGWGALTPNIFNNAKIGELVLPDGISKIPVAAFYGAEIGGELKIPDSVLLFEPAFTQAKLDTIILSKSLSNTNNSSPFWDAEVNEVIIPDGTWVIPGRLFNGMHGNSIDIPDSIGIIGEAAFYGNDFLDIDLDLPNLRTIGRSAFMKTSIRDVTLHDKLSSIGDGAFGYVPTLRNITLDCDFFGLSGFDYFYGVFNTADRSKDNIRQDVDSSVFGKITFTDKNITNVRYTSFLATVIDELDIANTKWTELTPYLFYKATINKPLALPSSIEKINSGAFQWANISIQGDLPEGLKTIGYASFFGADCFDDLVIPSTVTSILPEAFNAGDRDVFYESVTIKPSYLDYIASSGQAIFQMFWNSKMNKLVIDSEMLPILGTLSKDDDGKYVPSSGDYRCVIEEHTHNWSCYDEDGNTTPKKQKPEFHGMNFKEVVLNNVPAITANAFEECGNLEKVDLTQNANLQFIGRNAFLDAEKLKKIDFGDRLVDKEVAIGKYAFRNTGIETIGISDDDGFNLAAANFNTWNTGLDAETGEALFGADGYAFAEMPKLRSVSIPESFAYGNIPEYTFANDPELSEASLDWRVESMGDGTFNNDNKLKRLFIWGDTIINESNELTVPEVTTIFGYSDAPSDDYANTESREEYEGEFYALDEVLAITAKPNVVILNEDKTDFDKTGLKLYAQRRDGVILEADWKDYNTAFPRTNLPDNAKGISFEEGRGRVGSDTADIAAIIYDAPKPFEAISLNNKNFENVSYELVAMPSGDNPLAIVSYPDGYTGNVRKTTLITKTVAEIIEEIITPDPEPEPTLDPGPEQKPEPKPENKPEQKPTEEPEEELTVPDTGAFGAIAGAAASSISIAVIVVLGGICLAKRFRK